MRRESTPSTTARSLQEVGKGIRPGLRPVMTHRGMVFRGVMWGTTKGGIMEINGQSVEVYDDGELVIYLNPRKLVATGYRFFLTLRELRDMMRLLEDSGEKESHYVDSATKTGMYDRDF